MIVAEVTTVISGISIIVCIEKIVIYILYIKLLYTIYIYNIYIQLYTIYI